MKHLILLLLALCYLVVVQNTPVTSKRLSPVLDCYVNDGTNCVAYFGYLNQYEDVVNVSISNQNKFTPQPSDRGQPTQFLASTRAYRAFNVSRPCSEGNLVWTLTDPITGSTRTSTAGNMTGNTCTREIEPTCLQDTDCAINYVCNRTCVGIQGAFCNSTLPCASRYNCVSEKCQLSDANAFVLPSESRTCSTAPTLQCNSDVLIPLKESNTVPGILSCIGDSIIVYPGNTTIANFYMPRTNSTFDSLNATFIIRSPVVKVHVLTPCIFAYCNRLLSGTEISPGVFRYNHFYDYNDVNILRGYAFLVPVGFKFPSPDGIIVEASIDCLKINPLPPPSPPPIVFGCSSDASCTCGQCCSKELLLSCITCPDTCSSSATCPPSRPHCAANGRCTSNTSCPAFVPAPFAPRAPPPTIPPPPFKL